MKILFITSLLFLSSCFKTELGNPNNLPFEQDGRFEVVLSISSQANTAEYHSFKTGTYLGPSLPGTGGVKTKQDLCLESIEIFNSNGSYSTDYATLVANGTEVNSTTLDSNISNNSYHEINEFISRGSTLFVKYSRNAGGGVPNDTFDIRFSFKPDCN